MAKPGPEPGTPRFSGLCSRVSNTPKSLHRSLVVAVKAPSVDSQCLRTFRLGLGTRTAASTQSDPSLRPRVGGGGLEVIRVREKAPAGRCRDQVVGREGVARDV